MRRTLLAPALASALLLPLAAGPVGAAAPPVVEAAAGAFGTRYNDCLVLFHGLDLQTVSVPALQAAMEAGTFTSRELTQAYLDRIAAFDLGAVELNSIRTLTDDPLAQADAADRARAAGRTGDLLGIPLLLKDNIGTLDADTTAGSIALAGNRPVRDAPMTAQLREAGAVVLGKTNLSEFANWMSLGMPNGFSSLGGQVVAPYDQGDPSGSSSGSGVSGAMAFAAATFGSETAGSILSPSKVNSLVGIKPTVGMVSRKGIIPLAHSFDTAGPMTRNVTDAAALLSAVSAPDPTDDVTQRAPGGPVPDGDLTPFLRTGSLQGVRLGWSTADEPFDDEEAAVWAAARKALEDRGAELVETDTLANAGLIFLTEIAAIPSEFKFGIADYLRTEAGPVGEGGRPRLLTDDLTGVIAYNQQRPNEIPFGQNLLIASDATPGATESDPTSPATIQAAREVIDTTLQDDDLDAYVAPNVYYAGTGAAAGYPSISVPSGYTPDDELGLEPQAVQFLGTAWSEPALVGFAYDYEQATQVRVPPTVDDSEITESFCTARAAAGPPAAAPAAAPPGSTTPGSTAPGSTAPGSTAPGSTAPGSTAVPAGRALAATGSPAWPAAAGVLLVVAVAAVRRRRTPAAA
jgi:amidase